MNEFDQFMKHEMKLKHYARYTDDFVVVGDNPEVLTGYISVIAQFLKERLALTLHPKKVEIRRLYQGIDFLGYILFPNHRLMRTKTKRRMFRKFAYRVKEYRLGSIDRLILDRSLQSYLGALSHADGYETAQRLKNQLWLG